MQVVNGKSELFIPENRVEMTTCVSTNARNQTIAEILLVFNSRGNCIYANSGTL